MALEDAVLTIEANVRLPSGELIHLSKLVTRWDFDEVSPPKGPVSPFDTHSSFREQAERRQRWVDAVSAQFALALTQAIYEKVK